MLQNVELVVHDPALRHPLFQALAEWFPHIDTGGAYCTSLKHTEMLFEKLIQRFLLPLSPEPQRFSRLQIRHYGQKLLSLPQVNLIDPHLPQGWSPSPLGPAPQIAQVDRSHRARGYTKLPRHPA